MGNQTINNIETGPTLRQKLNDMFTELYARLRGSGAVDWGSETTNPSAAAIEARINAKAPAFAINTADAAPINANIDKIARLTHGNLAAKIIPHMGLSNNYFILDRYGNPNLMVFIPAFNWTAGQQFSAQGRPVEAPQSGGGTSYVLNGACSGTDGFYSSCLIVDRTAGHNNEVRKITDYVGGSKTATIDQAFTAAPTSYEVIALHPAFLTADAAGNIIKLKGFYVAKTKASVISNTGVIQNFESGRSGGAWGTGDQWRASSICAHSRMGLAPQVNHDYDASKAACDGMNNPGDSITTTGKFFMMSQAQRAAITIWTRYQVITLSKPWPRGNNLFGQDCDDKTVVFSPAGADGFTLGQSGTFRSLGGSGGSKTSHNLDPSGVFDLNGNCWEWQDGMKMVNNIYNLIPFGKAAGQPKYAGNNQDVGEADWINTGVAAPGTQPFANINMTQDYLKSLTLAPVNVGGDYNSDYFWIDPNGERVPICGGNWGASSNAGLYALSLYSPRSFVDYYVSWRPAFVIS